MFNKNWPQAGFTIYLSFLFYYYFWEPTDGFLQQKVLQISNFKFQIENSKHGQVLLPGQRRSFVKVIVGSAKCVFPLPIK